MTVNGDEMNAAFRFVSLGEATIADIHYGVDVDIEPLELDDCYLVHALIDGCSTLQHDGDSVLATTGTLHISSPAMRPRIHLTPESRHLTVRLPAELMRRYAFDTLGITMARPIEFEPVSLDSNPLPALWRDFLQHVLRQFEAAPDIMRARTTQHCYEMLMCELLFNHQIHNLSQLPPRAVATAMPRHVHKAKAIIRERFHEALSTSVLAAEVGVSVRSLHNGFRDFLDTTPAAYIRQYRIEKLHQKLSTPDIRLSVTEAMGEAGIINFGRYAGYYTAKYGCSPSETLRRSSGSR